MGGVIARVGRISGVGGAARLPRVGVGLRLGRKTVVLEEGVDDALAGARCGNCVCAES